MGIQMDGDWKGWIRMLLMIVPINVVVADVVVDCSKRIVVADVVVDCSDRCC